MQNYINIETIKATTNRLPFSDKDLNMLSVFLNKEARNSLIVRIHPTLSESIDKWIQDGVLVLTCPQIDTDIVYVKCNNGTGLLGGQKALFSNYMGNLDTDEFLTGASHRMFITGLTGINNIFRQYGLLKGGAF